MESTRTLFAIAKSRAVRRADDADRIPDCVDVTSSGEAISGFAIGWFRRHFAHGLDDDREVIEELVALFGR